MLILALLSLYNGYKYNNKKAKCKKIIQNMQNNLYYSTKLID